MIPHPRSLSAAVVAANSPFRSVVSTYATTTFPDLVRLDSTTCASTTGSTVRSAGSTYCTALAGAPRLHAFSAASTTTALTRPMVSAHSNPSASWNESGASRVWSQVMTKTLSARPSSFASMVDTEADLMMKR